MHIAVKASHQQQQALHNKGVRGDVRISFLVQGEPVPAADAYFDLLFDEELPAFTAITEQPVFVNAVIESGAHLPANVIRINAWNGFLERDVIEIVAADAMIDPAKKILDTLGWNYQFAPDVPGMIAARVIAMIINEAYFGWGDGISSKHDIDTAMKLGTNYPYGPFEWAEKIGLKKIAALLQALSAGDTRYTPAPALLQEVNE